MARQETPPAVRLCRLLTQPITLCHRSPWRPARKAADLDGRRERARRRTGRAYQDDLDDGLRREPAHRGRPESAGRACDRSGTCAVLTLC